MALGMSTPKRVFFIVVLVAIVASLVIMGEFYRTGAAIAYRPLQQARDHLGIQLFFADYIGKQVQGVDGAVWLGAARSTIQTNEGRTEVYPSLQFWVPGEFNGGRLVFKQIKTPTYTASAALSWPLNTPLFQYKIVFSSGLQSKLDSNNALDDLRDRRLKILGTTFTFLSGQSTYNPGTNNIHLRLMGGYGTIDLTDICDNQFTTGGVRVNGKSVDAHLRILCSQVNNIVRIESIEYRPLATTAAAITNDFDVLPKHGAQEYMLYPQALLTPEFNLFLAQVGSGGGAGANPAPSGGGDIVFDGSRRQWRATFSLLRGGRYQLDLLSNNPYAWGDGSRNFVVTEGNWINIQDYFALSAGNGLNDPSWIYMLNKIDTQNNIVYWRDMAGGRTKQANYNAGTNKGSMNIGGYSFSFDVDPANKRIKVDQNLAGGGTVELRTSARLLLKFGPAPGDVKLKVPAELRQEQFVDLVDSFKLLNDATMQVISPSMKDDISVEGREQGMDQFGNRLVLDRDRRPDELNIFTSGQQAAPQATVSSGGQTAAILLLTDKQSELKAMQQGS
ncbi:hypothetical protein GF343_00260 [Candidatus Woesearchaeota archaeon]|nr:hypothetical protein [Candidatus Woesearchaeota archaeon]